MTRIYDTRRVPNRRAGHGKERRSLTASDLVTAGAKAAARLLQQELDAIHLRGTLEAHAAHSAIENAEPRRKSREFYQPFFAWRASMVSVLAEGYRRFLKLALPHALRIGGEPSAWAWACIRPVIQFAVEEIREWTILACDGENQTARPLGTMEWTGEGQTSTLSISLPLPPAPPWKAWRAPGWLFLHYAPASGIGSLKTHHAAAQAGADGRLGAAQTRLILGGSRRLFLAELRSTTRRVRDEELAAAGALPVVNMTDGAPRRSRPLTKREEKLLEVIRQGARGRKYAIALDAAGLRPRRAWREQGCPSTHREAYASPSWRKRIWDEKTKLLARAEQ